MIVWFALVFFGAGAVGLLIDAFGGEPPGVAGLRRFNERQAHYARQDAARAAATDEEKAAAYAAWVASIRRDH